jgi:hypothetical protein
MDIAMTGTASVPRRGLFPDPLVSALPSFSKRVRPPGISPRPSADTRFFIGMGAFF